MIVSKRALCNGSTRMTPGKLLIILFGRKKRIHTINFELHMDLTGQLVQQTFQRDLCLFFIIERGTHCRKKM